MKLYACHAYGFPGHNIGAHWQKVDFVGVE